MDKYTKVVLTIIAGCLLWLCFTNTNLVTASNLTEVDIRSVGGYSIVGGVIHTKCQD